MLRWRRKLAACLSLAVGLVMPGMGRAELAIAVIVSRDAPALTLDHPTLRDIYLKKIVVDERGASLIPVNLPPDHPLRQLFSLDVLHADTGQLQRYWNERYFHGVRPPYVLRSQNAVLRFVADTAGAVGYVLSCRVDDSVRAVLSLPLPAADQAPLRAFCDDAGQH